MHSFPWSGVIECNLSQNWRFYTTNTKLLSALNVDSDAIDF